jgi:hypothetical protein
MERLWQECETNCSRQGQTFIQQKELSMMYARLQQLFTWISSEITPISQLADRLQ